MMSHLVKIYENLDFGKNLRESRFWSNFPKLSNLVKKFRKFSIFKNLDLGQNFSKTSILVNISKNLNFGQNFRNFLFWWKFLKKISILITIFEKSRILSKFLENLDIA